MSVAVHYQDLVVFWGDSISGVDNNEGGYRRRQPPGGLFDQVTALARPTATVGAAATSPTGARVSATNPTGGTAGVVPLPGYIVTVANNHNGQRWDNFAADDLPGWLAAMAGLAPSSPVFVLELGINDAKQIDGGTYTIGQAIAGMASAVSQIQAVYPAARFVFLSCFCNLEAWVNLPPPSWPVSQTSIVAVDNALQAQVSAIGANAVYVDNRTALLAWEVVNNPTMANYPIGTVDGTHPKINTMLAVMAVQFLATVAVGP